MTPIQSEVNNLIFQFKNSNTLSEIEFDLIVKKIKQIIFSFDPEGDLRVRADKLFNSQIPYYKEQYLHNIDIPNTEDYTHSTIYFLVFELEKNN